MTEQLEELRCRYPWPDKTPGLSFDGAGWFGGGTDILFQRLLDANTKIVVELGSLLGLSARAILKHAPNATLICIDHWQGSVEHKVRSDQGRGDWANRLPQLWDRFVSNMWEHRHRLVPMKTTICKGILELKELGITADLVYVDGAHDVQSVYDDVVAAMDVWPKAEIVGDDWEFGTVRLGVAKAAQHSRTVNVEGGQSWHMPPLHRQLQRNT